MEYISFKEHGFNGPSRFIKKLWSNLFGSLLHSLAYGIQSLLRTLNKIPLSLCLRNIQIIRRVQEQSLIQKTPREKLYFLMFTLWRLIV